MHQASQAELSALGWAIVLSRSFLQYAHTDVCFHIHVDSLIHLRAAEGTARWKAEQHSLLRALAAVLERLTVTTYTHAHAHKGHPWNELADVAANVMCKLHDSHLPQLPQSFHPSILDRSTHSRMTHLLDLHAHPWAFPPHIDNVARIIRFKPHQRHMRRQPYPNANDKRVPDDKAAVTLRMATADFLRWGAPRR